MSRVAKKPINLPKGVELSTQGETLNVKGPKGTLSIAKPAGVDVNVDNGVANLSLCDSSAGALAAMLAS